MSTRAKFATLGLTPADFNCDRSTVSINKSYQRINKQDVITPPKTKKSIRVVQMPNFLCEEIQEYETVNG